jgi:thymidine kinase
VWDIVAHNDTSMFHNTFILDPLHTKRMDYEPSARLDLTSDKVADIYAVCVNCNKRFTSIRAISMHLKVTASRHAVTFSNHGVYDKKTGLRTNNCANYYTTA